MKATSFSSVSVVERASLCEYSMGHPSSWLVALGTLSLCPVSPVLPIAPAATLHRDGSLAANLSREWLVAAPFVPRPLATHALPAQSVMMADSDEP